MKFSIAVLVLVLAGCQQSPYKHSGGTRPIETPAIRRVDCKDDSVQVNIYLKDRTLITDCHAIVDAMDKLFHPETPETISTGNCTVSGNNAACSTGDNNTVTINGVKQ